MTSDETYNGWTNWDTWSANLWLSNTEGPYRRLRRMAHQPPSEWKRAALDELDAMGNPDGIDYWKVNWQALYEAFGEE